MRSILSEKNLVVILFVMVLITFSLAQEDSKKMESIYLGTNTGAVINNQHKEVAAFSAAPLTDSVPRALPIQ